MFLWSPNAQPNRQLKLGLALSVLTLHLLVMGSYVFFSRPKPVIIKVSRSFNRNHVAVRVLPYLRQTGQLQRALQVQNSSKKTPIQQAAPTKRVARQVYKKPVAKTSTTPAKKFVKKQKQASKKAQKVQKKNTPKKIKKTVAQPEPPVHEPVHEVSKQEQPVIPPAQPIPAAQESAPEQTAESTGPLDVSITNTTEEIELGLEEYETLQAYQLIQSEMNTHWHPPAGFTPKRACIILITLNGRGIVTQMHVEQSSGILAYDMAARMAINRALFPKGVWDQQVRLHF